MGMKELERALERIEEDGSGDFEGAKPPELVAAAERKLGVAFPPTYRRFLQEMGCGDIAGFEVYGLVDEDFDDSSIPDAVWVTLDERKESALASSLVLVAVADDGGYFALDTAQAGRDGECPVVQWRPSQPGTQIAAPDFGTFLLEEIESALGED